MDQFDREKELSGLYSQTVKTYIQLSIGGLALSITFIDKVLGSDPKVEIVAWLLATWLLLLMWLLLLTSAVLGATYQYLGVRWLEWIADRENLLFKGVKRGKKGGFFVEHCVKHCSRFYVAMLIAFYAGCLCFAVFGLLRLLTIVV
jgi:hypothetical protein